MARDGKIGVEQLGGAGAGPSRIPVHDGSRATWTDLAAAVTAAGAGYTDEQVRDVIGAALTAGTGITVTPNDGADTITIANTVSAYTDENARDAIGTALVAGTGVTITVNDGADTITIDASGGGITPVMAAYTSTVAESNSALPVGSSFAEWRTAARLTVAATSGDKLLMSGSAMIDNQSTTVYFDWAVINAGTNAIIRRLGGGFGLGFASGSAYSTPPLLGDFTVAAGDIVSGNVTVNTVWKAGGSGARSLLLADYLYAHRLVNLHH